MSYAAWAYYKLVNNRLVDSEYGGDVNFYFPDFHSVQEAENYLLEHDIRATVVGEGTAIREVTSKYPELIMAKVRQRLGLESYDTSRDADINNMSQDEVFQHCLYWEGIIGFENQIKGWVKDIYGVELGDMYRYR